MDTTRCSLATIDPLIATDFAKDPARLPFDFIEAPKRSADGTELEVPARLVIEAYRLRR